MNNMQELKNSAGMSGDLLSLDPSEELVFHGPFNRSVCKKLVIGNTSKTTSVAFKMKTTSPRLFFVRPNIGMLAPNESVTVDIFMQPIVIEPGQKRHKFLILGAPAPPEVTDLTEFWKQQKSGHIWDTKIKCELVPAKSDDQYRQAGGGMVAASPRSDTEGEYDALEVSEPVAKLLKQVSVLEDERSALKDEIKMMREDGVEQRMIRRSQEGRRSLFTFIACIFTVLAAIVGAFYGKHYL